MKKPRYRAIASLVMARENCKATGNDEWYGRHGDTIARIMESAPSGSGIDNGTDFDFSNSTPDKLIFSASYHHMDDGGYYDGWTEHTITVKPSLAFGIDLHISGRDRNQFKDYLYDVFQTWLTEEIET